MTYAETRIRQICCFARSYLDRLNLRRIAIKPMLCLIIFLISSPASARDWYLINNNTNQCENLQQFNEDFGLPDLASPSDVRAFFEGGGYDVTVNEVKDPVGAPVIFMVINYANGTNLTVTVFLPSVQDCRNLLAKEMSDGSIVNPRDLK